MKLKCASDFDPTSTPCNVQVHVLSAVQACIHVFIKKLFTTRIQSRVTMQGVNLPLLVLPEVYGASVFCASVCAMVGGSAHKEKSRYVLTSD